jgi:hypothetical protein
MFGTGECSRLLPIIGMLPLVRPEGFDDMQEYECVGIKETLGVTNHDFGISKCNSCQNRFT